MSSELRSAASSFGAALADVYLPPLERLVEFLSTLNGTSAGAESAMHVVATRLVLRSTRQRRARMYAHGMRRKTIPAPPLSPFVLDAEGVEKMIAGIRKALEPLERLARSPLGQALIEAERKRRLEAVGRAK